MIVVLREQEQLRLNVLRGKEEESSRTVIKKYRIRNLHYKFANKLIINIEGGNWRDDCCGHHKLFKKVTGQVHFVDHVSLWRLEKNQAVTRDKKNAVISYRFLIKFN